MVRTVISLDINDKSWLAREAEREHVSMAEIIRRAIRRYRGATAAVDEPPFEQLLEATTGIWEKGDGLSYQERIRGEWDEPR